MLLTESSHVSFVYEESECSLVVLSTGTQDGGVYTCTARNLAGEVSCKAELAVRSGGLEREGRRATGFFSSGMPCEPLAGNPPPGNSPPGPSLLNHHSLPAPAPHLRPSMFLLLFCLLHLPCLSLSLTCYSFFFF